MSSAQARRLAIPAIGKLAGLADPKKAVSAFAPLLNDPHPQVRQYTIKALSAYGTEAAETLGDLQDIADNPVEKEYNRRDAALAENNIREALRIKEEQIEHTCIKCAKIVNHGEYARSQKMFQRIYCDYCFDEVFLQRRNWDTKVEINKNIQTEDGTFVQSHGERLIAECLAAHAIKYRYDERIRIIEGYAVRPDFYLPEFDVYIEYWGMDTIDYKIGMLKKQKVYQMTGKKLLSLYPEDKQRLDQIMHEKLSKYIKLSPINQHQENDHE